MSFKALVSWLLLNYSVLAVITSIGASIMDEMAVASLANLQVPMVFCWQECIASLAKLILA